MGSWWILVTVTLIIAIVQLRSEPSADRRKSTVSLEDRINSLERDLLKLSGEVSVNKIVHLRIELSHYYYLSLLIIGNNKTENTT